MGKTKKRSEANEDEPTSMSPGKAARTEEEADAVINLEPHPNEDPTLPPSSPRLSASSGTPTPQPSPARVVTQLTPCAREGTAQCLLLLTAHFHSLWTIQFVERWDGTDEHVFLGKRDNKVTPTYAFTKCANPWNKVKKRHSTNGDMSDNSQWVFYRMNPTPTLANARTLETELSSKIAKVREQASLLPNTNPELVEAKKFWLREWQVVLTNDITENGELVCQTWDTALTNKDIGWNTRGPKTQFPRYTLANLNEAGGFFVPGSPYDLVTCLSNFPNSSGSGGSAATAAAAATPDFASLL
eukprot:CAMPEP_0181328528 /NCGR_PEP_ID=MMETSP1101-20121128/22777_1 /TAXON_ID=46948 /ORGANISM="Rhodomonas abbreviata, Strain Caron Lab Isolate" /LENGTH=299 /DNA_ID=CAMNT_0023437449 /DNA_START=47 /DNA_END=946 /DNA_ORIENTATION=-